MSGPSITESLQCAVELDRSLQFLTRGISHCKEFNPNPSTHEGDPTLSVRFSSCRRQTQNSELNSTVGSGRNLAQASFSPAAALWAACGWYQVMVFRAPDFLQKPLEKPAPISSFQFEKVCTYRCAYTCPEIFFFNHEIESFRAWPKPLFNSRKPI